MTQPAAETCSTVLSTPRSHHTCCFGSTVPKSVGVWSKKCAHRLPVWMKWKVWIYQKCGLQIIRLYKQSFPQITKHILLFGQAPCKEESNAKPPMFVFFFNRPCYSAACQHFRLSHIYHKRTRPRHTRRISSHVHMHMCCFGAHSRRRAPRFKCNWRSEGRMCAQHDTTE